MMMMIDDDANDNSLACVQVKYFCLVGVANWFCRSVRRVICFILITKLAKFEHTMN